ncbi:hypothetical protein [Auritidibacter ignavus]|uniref:hypothetical protein n=1 Tax=Auritidibacter ignavus TaxID=678932 RepID=UPI000F025723|nr:hypothetical protein [Auritidibacter ignavus]NIH72034.1 hypothetical protein [Auritidibacter ignavus]RMX23949.1 hypothetical protein DYI20_02120 [Auritidibacter ignavus]WGH89914.1 hypothetical protein QDX23_07145 [Auritidibacter ignavus]WHS34125.1 hypothetical protein QM403_07050 [Auritidibacter ignavus]
MITDIPLRPEHDGSALYLLGPTDPTTLESIVIAASRSLMIDAVGTGPIKATLQSMAAPHHVGLRATLPTPSVDDPAPQPGPGPDHPNTAVVSVPLSEEVRIRGLISARGISGGRIGVVDASTEAVEITAPVAPGPDKES